MFAAERMETLNVEWLKVERVETYQTKVTSVPVRQGIDITPMRSNVMVFIKLTHFNRFHKWNLIPLSIKKFCHNWATFYCIEIISSSSSTDIDECVENPCTTEGTQNCDNGVNQRTCNCKVGWSHDSDGDCTGTSGAIVFPKVLGLLVVKCIEI